MNRKTASYIFLISGIILFASAAHGASLGNAGEFLIKWALSIVLTVTAIINYILYSPPEKT